MRACRSSLAAIALFTAFACADSDRKSLATQHGDATLVLADVTLQTLEDTPISGTAAVQGYAGTLTTQIVSQGTKGTLTFSPASTSFTYTPNKDVNGDDTVLIAVSDAETQARATVHITIVAVDDPPALAGSTTLIMAEDSILNINLANVIVVDKDSDRSQLSLTLLPSALYISSGNTLRPLPDFNGDLHVFVMLYDGTASSTVELDVTVTPVNDPPVNTVPPPQRTPVDAPFTFTGAVAPKVHDIDAGDAPLAITLSTDQGTLTLSQTNDLAFTTGTGTNDSTVVFSGSQTAVTAALSGLVFTPPAAFTGLATLTLTTNDQGASGAGVALTDTDTFIVGVGSVDLPPFNTLDGTASIDEDTTLTFGTVGNPIGVSDPDAGDTTAQVSMSVDVGALTLSATTGLSFTDGSGTGDPHMTFSGTIVAINAALNGMVYTPTPNFAGPVTLTLTSTTNALSDTDTMTIGVLAINDAPTIAGPTAISAASGADVHFTGLNSVVIGDVDAGTGTMNLTITVSGGLVSLGTNAAVTPDEDTGTSYVANATRPLLNSVLAGMVFHAGATRSSAIDIVVNDNGNTGAGGAQTGSLHIVITVNEPPVATTDGYQTSGNTTLTVASADAGILANDTDDNGGVTLTTTGDISTTLSGTVHLAADGTFTYDPPLGVANTDDSFTYTIKDSDNATADGTVTISIGRAIWYVSESAANGGGGSDGAPFQDIGSALAVAGTNSTIYVGAAADAYAGGFTLAAGQQLVGAGVDLPRNGNPTISASTAPQVIGDNGTGAVITMSSNAQVRGITINPATPQTYAGINVSGAADVSITNLEIHNQSPQIAIANTTGTITIAAVKLFDANGDAVTASTAAPLTSAININNSTINGTSLGNGILARAGGGTMNLTIDTVTFLEIDTNGVDAASSGASTMNVSCHACFMQNDPANALGDTAIRVVASGNGAVARADVDASLFDAWPGTAIAVEGAGAGTSFNGTLSNNTIGSAIAGSLLIGGITIELDADDTTGGAAAAVLLDTNTLTLTGAGVPGIAAFTRQGASHALDLTLTNNHVTTTTADGIDVTSDPGATVCADFSNDTAAGGFHLDTGGGTIRLPGYPGGDLQTYFNGNTNTGSATSTGTPVGGVDCTLPPS